MRQQLIHKTVHFSAEHMAAIRRHFNAAQQYAGHFSAAASHEMKNDNKSPVGTKEKNPKWMLRDWAFGSEALLPEWRAVAAYFAFAFGLMMILGIYLLPH